MREYHGRYRSRARRNTGVVALLVVAAVIAMGVGAVSYALSRETVETVVLDKDRVCDSSNSEGEITCRYLVFTEAGTFQLTDSIFAGRFDSSDAYGRVRVCHRYRIDKFGWRIPAFSWYPTIDEMEDLGRADGCES